MARRCSWTWTADGLLLIPCGWTSCRIVGAGSGSRQPYCKKGGGCDDRLSPLLSATGGQPLSPHASVYSLLLSLWLGFSPDLL